MPQAAAGRRATAARRDHFGTLPKRGMVRVKRTKRKKKASGGILQKVLLFGKETGQIGEITVVMAAAAALRVLEAVGRLSGCGSNE